MLATAGGVYAFDSSRRQTIAEGVTVSGIDVGGLQRSAAREKLRSALLDPLNEPVLVRYKKHRFRLTPNQAKIGIDLDGSVQEALNRSRRGNVLTRVVREIKGDRVHADVPVEVSHSKAAIRRLVKRVAETINTEPKDADVSFEGGQINPKPSREGRKVRTARLARDLEETLLSTDSERMVRVRTRVIKPKVTTEEVGKKYPAVLFVNRGAFKLTLYKNLKPAKSYGIAVGQVGLDTPAGLYKIQNKAINPAWSVPNSAWAGSLAGKVIPGGTPENPLKARWLGVYDGVGIHGTSASGSIGSNASHGCIRMLIPDVIELYDQVPVGAPIYIS